MAKTETTKSVFETLSSLNVNDHVEKKDNLTYLSWAWAWSAVKKVYPDTTYAILETTYDDDLGFMCNTSVTIQGETLCMWLPVMDSKNRSMKKKPYTYATKYGEKTVDAATSFDINKTIMRCLVKNLAMFGLGIYIYAGEDLPESETASVSPVTQPAKKDVAFPALKNKTPEWDSVVKYVEANKTLGVDKIIAQVGRKYTLTQGAIDAITVIINS